MGQYFTAGSIAAIVAVIVMLLIVIAVVVTTPIKKNAGVNHNTDSLNGRIKDGVSVRIMSIATGRYFRRRPDADACSTPSSTVVTADATRAAATIWKMTLCSSCPPSSTPGLVGFSPFPVEGKWVIYEQTEFDVIHALTFGQFQVGNPPSLVDNRLKTFRFGNTTEIYNKGTVATVAPPQPAVPPVNNFLANYWLDLETIAEDGGSGPNGAYEISSQVSLVDKYGLYDFNAFGLYVNAAYVPVLGSPAPGPPGDWVDKSQCHSLRGFDYSADQVRAGFNFGFFFETV
jgi:hypothetical protein